MTVNKGPLIGTTQATAGSVTVALYPRIRPTGEWEIQDVRTASTLGLRRFATKVLVDMPLSGIAGDAGEMLLRTFYALCPEAHVAAWRLATEVIVGREKPAFEASEYAQLNRRVALEAALGHLRLLTLDMPRALGLGVEGDRKCLAHAQAQTQVEGVTPLIEAVEALITGRAVERCSSHVSSEALGAWARAGTTLCARIFQVFFVWRAEAQSAWTLFIERLMRRLNDLLEITVALKSGSALRSRLHLGRRTPRPSVQELEGLKSIRTATVQVDTARGALRWRLEAEVKPENNVFTVRQLDISAPTDRHFAPGGIAERLLRGLKAPNEATLRARAEAMVTAVDPCTERILTIHPVEASYA